MRKDYELDETVVGQYNKSANKETERQALKIQQNLIKHQEVHGLIQELIATLASHIYWLVTGSCHTG